MANPGLVIVALLLGIAAGISLNYCLNKYIKQLWLKILLFLGGTFLLGLILSGLGKLFILRTIPSAGNIGAAIGAGIGMALGYVFFIIIGLILFILSFAITSLVRYFRKKRQKF